MRLLRSRETRMEQECSNFETRMELAIHAWWLLSGLGFTSIASFFPADMNLTIMLIQSESFCHFNKWLRLYVPVVTWHPCDLFLQHRPVGSQHPLGAEWYWTCSGKLHSVGESVCHGSNLSFSSFHTIYPLLLSSHSFLSFILLLSFISWFHSFTRATSQFQSTLKILRTKLYSFSAEVCLSVYLSVCFGWVLFQWTLTCILKQSYSPLAAHAAVKQFSFSGWQGFSEGWFELHSIVHAGNSGFETADNIVGNAAYIHMIGR